MLFFLPMTQDAIRPFSCEEFGILLNGRPDIDVPSLKSGVMYTGGYETASKPIVHFWAAMMKWTTKEKQALLEFVTGSNRVPLDGFDPPFTITLSDLGAEALPKR